MVTIVKSDFEFRRESNQFVHCMPTSHQISMLYYGRQRPKESGRKTTYLWSYSLICIRQNYNFDMLAAIWLEIVSWFLTISQDLRNMITKLFSFWFSYHCRILWSQQTRTGKKPEINKKCHVKWWLKYRNNGSVSWRLSCIYFGSEMLIMIRVRAHAYLSPALAECNEYQQTCILQAKPKPNPLSITMVLKPSFPPCKALHYYLVLLCLRCINSRQFHLSTQLCSSTLVCKFNFQLLPFNWRNNDFDELKLQCNLNLVTPYLMTNLNLVTILQKTIFLRHENIWFSNNLVFSATSI